MTQAAPAPDPRPTDTQITVQDGGRHIQFTGRQLSRVSSERESAPRWTVMELYRTVRGLYVISRIGKSIVYHTSDCPQARSNRHRFGHELKDGVPTVEDLQKMAPCSTCRPRPTDPGETLRFERERHFAGVAETPDALVQMLHRNDNGQRTLPWIASNLLDKAAVQDAGIADAYRTTVME